MNFEIKPVGPSDFDAWVELWKGYQAFYNVDIPAATTARTWARMQDEREPVHSALAWCEGEAVGLVNWVFHRSTWTTGDYCYLQDLFVDPAVRGRSIGRGLIQHVYDTARQHGAARVYWLTHESNHTAMRLYDDVAEKSGFVQYRRQL